MCVLSIDVPIRKKSENLFNDPRIYIFIYESKWLSKIRQYREKIDKKVIQAEEEIYWDTK